MLPTALRKAVIKAYLKVLATPLLAYYTISGAYYQLKLNELQPNLLTDVLQALLRTIYPNTSGTNFKCWVYNQYELTHKFIYSISVGIYYRKMIIASVKPLHRNTIILLANKYRNTIM